MMKPLPSIPDRERAADNTLKMPQGTAVLSRKRKNIYFYVGTDVYGVDYFSKDLKEALAFPVNQRILNTLYLSDPELFHLSRYTIFNREEHHNA